MNRYIVLRLRERVSFRTPSRAVVITGLLVVLALVTAVISLGLGELRVSAVDVVRTLFGHTRPDLETVIVQWRLPRVLLALTLGAGLGLGGAVFQSLTRNPLGSPDVIGFDAGAHAAAVVSIVAVGGAAFVIPSAIAGGVVTALTVYLLAYRRGVQGFRLIVVGIGVTALLGSLTSYLIQQADLRTAQLAAVWGAGSLNGLDWDDARHALAVTAVLLIPMFWLVRGLKTLELGDDAAAALGIPVERTRLALVVVGVSLTAVATALAGPIPFVALVAPQLARRLTGAPGAQPVAAAVMGALLLITCDTVAVHVPSPMLPVGLMTVMLGGGYLLWLLVTQSRKELR